MSAFTDTAIKKLPVKETAYRRFEKGTLPGFGIAIAPTGGKSFFVQHTSGGTRRFYKIGAYPFMPLSLAREKAKELLSKLEQDIDPRAVVVSGTVADLLGAWIRHQGDNDRRNLPETEQIVKANVPEKLMAMPARDITSADIRGILATVHQRGARVQANRVRSHLHSMFSYGLKADHDPRRMAEPTLFGLTVNPVSAIPRDNGAESARDRALSWDEVRAVWYSDAMTWYSRQAVRLLLLTGARVNEIAQARWSEFDLATGLWTLPAERSKNHRALTTPINPLMAGLLGELRDVMPDSDWLFPARNMAGATAPWGNSALAHAVRNAQASCAEFPGDWRPQDLRRTMKTLAVGAGIDRGILDKIQNHAQSDVASKHYDRHEYVSEKRAALMAWDEKILEKL